MTINAPILNVEGSKTRHLSKFTMTVQQYVVDLLEVQIGHYCSGSNGLYNLGIAQTDGNV